MLFPQFARLLLIVLGCASLELITSPANAQAPAGAAATSPAAVVSRWLDLHRAKKENEADALTVGNGRHRAKHFLAPSETGVRVERSLGNEHAAAVVTTNVETTHKEEEVLLFWLVRREGVWKINKSDIAERSVADEQLRGFFENGDVRWHVRKSDLLSKWESGPSHPPGIGQVCGSRLILSDDNQYQLGTWGPAAPRGELGDEVESGTWQLKDGVLLISRAKQTWECPIVWFTPYEFHIESADGKINVDYRRMETKLP